MNPLDWHKKRLNHSMPVYSELVLAMTHKLQPITVMELVTACVDRKIASIATVHAAIKWLKTHGFLETKPMEDQRLKLCSVTTKGRKYMEHV